MFPTVNSAADLFRSVAPPAQLQNRSREPDASGSACIGIPFSTLLILIPREGFCDLSEWDHVAVVPRTGLQDLRASSDSWLTRQPRFNCNVHTASEAA